MNEIRKNLEIAINELFAVAKLEKNDILVVGCSTSEVLGDKIGTNGSADAAEVIFSTLKEMCDKEGIFLAAQCCEHLNRAIVIEKKAYDYYRMQNRVNAVPVRRAGGSFATAAYAGFENPVVVESVRADAGIDIGDTFIGMHIREVAVPVRVSVNTIGCAHLTLCRTRPKYIGGVRANYDEELG